MLEPDEAYEPALHVWHAAADVAAEAVEYEPVAQLEHVDDPEEAS